MSFLKPVRRTGTGLRGLARHARGAVRAVLACLALVAAPLGAAERFGDYDPVDFGPRGPASHPVHGIDVARFQEMIDWRRVAASGVHTLSCSTSASESSTSTPPNTGLRLFQPRSGCGPRESTLGLRR